MTIRSHRRTAVLGAALGAVCTAAALTATASAGPAAPPTAGSAVPPVVAAGPAGAQVVGVAVAAPVPDGATFAPAADCALPPLDLAAIADEQRRLADYLRERDIPFTTRASDGVDWVVPEESEQAAAALSDYAWELHPLSEQEIASLNAETARLVAFLASRGIAVDVRTDGHGIETPDLAEAGQAAIDALADYRPDPAGVLVEGDAGVAVVDVAVSSTPTDATGPAPEVALPAEAVELPEGACVISIEAPSPSPGG